LLLNTLGSHCQVHPWILFHQSQCGGKSSTKFEDLFQDDIILDAI
jgi:hypothetical protein